jgi:DNA-binding transcriptional regulator YiaG
MHKSVCPVCGVGELEREEKEFTVSKFGYSESKTVTVFFCPLCEAEFFENKQDEQVKNELIKKIQLKNVQKKLEEMASSKKSFASLERALSLPQRTLSKWKNGATKPSEAGMVLVNLLSIMPWLSLVVDNDYDPKLAQSLQWANLCSSFEGAVQTGILENGSEKLLYAYARNKVKTESMSATQSSYVEEVWHEIV